MLRTAARFALSALLLISAKANPAAAESPIDTLVPKEQAVLSKFDPRFKSVLKSEFTIQNDDLKINIEADKPVYCDGKPYGDGTPKDALYGQVDVAEKFYGIEVIVHYSLLHSDAVLGGAVVRERV